MGKVRFDSGYFTEDGTFFKDSRSAEEYQLKKDITLWIDSYSDIVGRILQRYTIEERYDFPKTPETE